ncbi:MAG: hypothetical protein J1E96_04610, partial [Ruminococcus sp.]|nr:hypothetical protein [Ruminococcus sp.]
MITIKKNGKFIIPENEVFIGHAGDNLNVTKEFFVDGVTDVSLVYRMYLQFDDGTTNFFLLDSETTENGTKLVWNVTNDQIYKSGILKMQIKASNSSGVVFHSAITSLVAHTSIEFGEAYKNKENSEFLQHEQYLNDLIDKEREYLEELKEYEAGLTDRTRMDSEPVENSPRAVQSGGIYNALKAKLDNADGSVKENNIENGAVTGAKLSSTLYAKIFSDSLGYTSLGGEANPEANPFDTNITPSRLCTCVYNDTRYIFISTWWLFNNEQPAPAQYRFSDNGIELRRYSYADKQWSDWEFVGKEAEIADGSVTAEKLSAELRDTIDTLN